MKAHIEKKKDSHVVDLENGLNPVTVNLKKIKRSKCHEIVQSGEKPADFNTENPDPYKDFQGKNGLWYRISTWEFKGNCYAYAMGWAIDAPNTGWFIPGFLTGRIPRENSEIVSLITEDLKMVGRKVHKVIMPEDIPEQLPEAPKGAYWVKVFLQGNDFLNGFHISRKDETSGRWLHKLGWTCPPKVVMDNQEAAYPEEIRLNIEFLQSVGLPINFPKVVTRSTWETDDRATYRARNPESLEDFEVYEPFAVMLIDE